MMIADEIKRLHELHQAGALSDAEFEQAKARLLSTANIRLDKDASSSRFAGDLNSLRRSRTDRWLSGVCGGLAVATRVDSWVWRLLFALLTLTFGFGAVIYLLLWIFVPEEGVPATTD
ncbi:PspC domain-containing protein [Massilia forsythiae]|uniref:PspC domain-containing protein n=1 Tax=Massilia forsythiae TaxID=2728020 RepID=A0A7Z2ZVD4_9BURK|nr:PspC domain-containing protein [Massilia forsythiae]QJE03384.1 PspC domain-containing protein [Massilia forsythiae]